MFQIEQKFKEHFGDINSTNFSGAMDVIVIQQEDGSLTSSSFIVQFGILDIFKTKDKVINIEVNGRKIIDVTMRLFDTGVAYFLPDDSISQRTRNSDPETPRDSSLLRFNLTTLNAYHRASHALGRTFSKRERIAEAGLPQRPQRLCYQTSRVDSTSTDKSYEDMDLSDSESVEIQSPTRRCSSLKIKKSGAFFQTRRPPPDSVLSFHDPPESAFGIRDQSDDIESPEINEPVEAVDDKTKANCNVPRRAISIESESAAGSALGFRQIEDIFEEYANNARTKKKLIHLTSAKLKTLNLRYGHNIIQYTAATAPTDDTYTDSSKAKRLSANIFLWHHSDKIIISDIDGTITKSDIRGQILTLFGQNWYHENIAPLFSALSERNYKIIYLSARSICQTDHTRNLIKNINQSTFRMPKGPLLLNPNQLFSSIHNEIIPAKVDEKLISLQNIRSLFGATRNPFYAGFGNKMNDYIVYRNVDINEENIFIVSKNGQINEQTKRDLSYSILLNDISDYFPNNLP